MWQTKIWPCGEQKFGHSGSHTWNRLLSSADSLPPIPNGTQESECGTNSLETISSALSRGHLTRPQPQRAHSTTSITRNKMKDRVSNANMTVDEPGRVAFWRTYSSHSIKVKSIERTGMSSFIGTEDHANSLKWHGCSELLADVRVTFPAPGEAAFTLSPTISLATITEAVTRKSAFARWTRWLQYAPAAPSAAFLKTLSPCSWSPGCSISSPTVATPILLFTPMPGKVASLYSAVTELLCLENVIYDTAPYLAHALVDLPSDTDNVQLTNMPVHMYMPDGSGQEVMSVRVPKRALIHVAVEGFNLDRDIWSSETKYLSIDVNSSLLAFSDSQNVKGPEAAAANGEMTLTFEENAAPVPPCPSPQRTCWEIKMQSSDCFHKLHRLKQLIMIWPIYIHMAVSIQVEDSL
ncbi:uncharacterized protein LAESUDRAFT_717802 [Laetiporus sulphureus 93-53]|uniref:Uncharacterized protein n=1 Tax=Laetiporus sulphureus 93-53 TaxID=1314785 RepID=A0A165BGF8_9APHY|nr:uncharacterized protein LAESUDRAFT_717802 [Laetiporus sulphureus 93-53]KZT01011.1 hypothetical protein LAESUDRAFT_717802 [Laetiporus sulphureus 93-53]